ncbi:DNA gyrase inhibitor YacG [Hyphomicrobium sp.]|jgi:endogenous inhibitor of DNA gyrase (YacG/DUF329 family)|uniref:DNA gyrase inhibitor YacG n=1 Tax=Hyphomicrobium sp. TaxID=82 RepID=UPI002C368C05|nr:DNA gyrase inhibitor YacG [Hyphomicrobium sp.]HVZ04460.1 DNA gyrase inhibitor YacG [Hyphomicrobium sp.]
MPSPQDPRKRPVRCPICGNTAVEAYRPFCSKRCADIDLGKWFSGGYAVAGRDEDEGDGAGANDEKRSSDGDKK